MTAAVAFGIANYATITGDTSFLYGRGAEILTQTARFWASRCEWKEDAGRYEITQVTGPDEWHEPVDNNTYTNYLARWNMRYVIALVDRMQREHPDDYAALIAATGLTDAELASWDAIQSKIYLPRKEDTDLLEQFEGYFDLEPVTIEEYDKNDWPVRPAALKQFKTSETQIIKQPDVVMLLHLLGNEFSQQEIETNYHYYEKRTLHGSSLSPSIYAIMGLKVGDDSKAYRYLRRAAMLDLLNLQRNTREHPRGQCRWRMANGRVRVRRSEHGRRWRIVHHAPHAPRMVVADIPSAQPGVVARDSCRCDQWCRCGGA